MRADEKDRRDESLMREQEMMKKNKRRFRAFERARQVWWNKRMKRKDGVQCICIILIKGLIKKLYFFLDECYSAHL